MDHALAPEGFRAAAALVRQAADVFAAERITAVHAKSATDFVTNVDFAIQTRLRGQLAALAPDVQFIGEEDDAASVDRTKPYWLLDPVDGTTNLIHGLNHSAVSLALVEQGAVSFGVVCDPYSRECFTAVRGEGARMNGAPIRCSRNQELDSCLVSAGTAPGHRDLADEVFSAIRKVYDACQDIRHGGCASLDLCHIACGRLDGYFERVLHPWDYAAGMLIVNEAGGAVTDFDGCAPSLETPSEIAASNGAVHRELAAILRRPMRERA